MNLRSSPGHRILAAHMGLRIFSESEAAALSRPERERENMALLWLLTQDRKDLLPGAPLRTRIEAGTWKAEFETWLFEVDDEILAASIPADVAAPAPAKKGPRTTPAKARARKR
jgi:hypothetical protein